MEEEQLLNTAKILCHRWESVHGQLLQMNNPQIKSRLLYEEQELERSFERLMGSYRSYLKQDIKGR